ncbi:MAG: hypothetical protein VYA86_04940, partial [Candidatus Thermoplasmatota archaeon]|nr:hypothetical protein [Candidatus Thermoplasmatota archaeon]
PQNETSNQLYGDVSRPSSFNNLIQIADEIVANVDTPRVEYAPNGETHILCSKNSRKTVRGELESWISLTSPLKHLLSTRSGVHAIDKSLENGAVNQLRWNGDHWYCAGTDGRGLVLIARHFGFDFDQKGIESPLLCMKGGGGAARSCAVNWAEAGGRIWSMGGRRALGNRGPWVGHLIEGDTVVDHIGNRLMIDFDIDPASPTPSPSASADLHVISSYNTEQYNAVIQTETGTILDGRWLLSAQHLCAWADLFEPDLRQFLPGLALTMTWMNKMESALRAD